ncbi:MAG: helix-turn-helix domain-containing protein [Actinomycetota bacterium]|nr:helix-turn-helix domain-containing protein [Actinomycetota bacterium]
MERAPLNPTEFASAVTAISSAFGDQTRRDIFLFVHHQGDGVTAAEVAERFDLHVNVARHHLDKLAAGGYVEVETQRNRRTGAGRPSKHYKAAEPELGPQLPVRHDVVLVNLLNRALAMLEPAAAEEMAEAVGEEYGRAMAESMGDLAESQRSFRTALHMVADAMTAHGFAAEIDDRADGLRLVTNNCPFGGAEVVHPVLCAVDRGMVKGMLDTLYGTSSTARQSSMATGGESCATSVGIDS